MIVILANIVWLGWLIRPSRISISSSWLSSHSFPGPSFFVASSTPAHLNMHGTFLALTFAAGALAQSSSTYFDDSTGITFQSYLDSNIGISYGVALPVDTSNDVIGQIVGPANAAWAGSISAPRWLTTCLW